jgi:NTE family protein
MDTEREGYCLVLGGGGAKGVYHIGVWRALRELKVPVDAFVGASIGAIMAGFLAQGLDEALEDIGRTITLDNILALPRELTEGGEVKLDHGTLASVRDLFLSTMAKRGLDTSPLRNLLVARLDEGAIRAGGKDLGIVTVNVSDLEPREVFIEDMEPGALVDYLMASAAFPGFEQPRIEGKSYSDGGLYDNVPYAMARKRGYRRIIVSDISGAGRNRRPQIEGSDTVYIKNSIEMGGVLDFDRKFLDSFAKLGYLDTMRTFGRYIGYSYFVEPDPEAEASVPAGAELAAKTGSADKERRAAEAEHSPHPAVAVIQFPERMRYDRRKLLLFLECAASVLDVDRVEAYSYGSLEKAILTRLAEVEARMASAKAAAGSGLRGLAPMLREAVTKLRLDECPYYYHRLVREAFPNSTGKMLEKILVGLHPELPVGVAWLEASGNK